MVRCIWSGILLAALLGGTPSPLPAQTEPSAPEQKPAPKDQYFSGTVTAIDDATLVVSKTVLGKGPIEHKFLITPATHFEGGKPKVKAKVTVRDATTAEGDCAVRVIARPAAAPAPPKK